MDFDVVLDRVVRRFDEAGLRFALIGGFAMALHGLQRATIDLDFILVLGDLDRANEILEESGYRRKLRTENVSHYEADTAAMGRIDILHAFRGPSLGMLDRAERLPVEGRVSVPVVQPEDIIGLKLQALTNNLRRAAGDWSDIRMILETLGRGNRSVDWERVGDYLEIFDLGNRIEDLENWYREPH